MIAKTAHIGRIIVSHPGFEAPVANFSGTSKFPRESRKDQSGTAYRATGSSERRRRPASELPQTMVRSIWKWLARDPSTYLQVFPEESAIGRPGGPASAYRVAPRYVVHTALAKVWDVFRAHAFSTSATTDGMLIFGCVWPLAAAT